MKRIKLSADLEEVDDSHACDWCSTPEHQAVVMERGIVEADYKLKNTYGAVLGYVCRACLDSFERAG